MQIEGIALCALRRQLLAGALDDEANVAALERDGRAGARAIGASLRRRLRARRQQQQRQEILLGPERQLWADGITTVAGVDEVGRGPLAGPVVAAAVVLPQDAVIWGLDDSKRLGDARREALSAEIMMVADAVGIGIASAAEIDRVNIRAASLLAMRRALVAMRLPPLSKELSAVSTVDCGSESAGHGEIIADVVLVDGRDLIPGVSCRQQALIGGDGICRCIAAASVLAKVTRDRQMATLARRFPEFGFDRHFGYGVKQHLEALRQHGPTPIHRQSFGPVKRAKTRSDETTLD